MQILKFSTKAYRALALGQSAGGLPQSHGPWKPWGQQFGGSLPGELPQRQGLWQLHFKKNTKYHQLIKLPCNLPHSVK